MGSQDLPKNLISNFQKNQAKGGLDLFLTWQEPILTTD